MWNNPTTGKGWTGSEEETFAEIMRAGNLTRIKAIHLWARSKRNAERAIETARENYGRSEAQTAASESTKAARLAALSKVNARRPQNGSIQRQNASA